MRLAGERHERVGGEEREGRLARGGAALGFGQQPIADAAKLFRESVSGAR